MKRNFLTARLFAQAFAVALLWLGACAACFFYTGHTAFQISLCLSASIGLSALLWYADRSGRSVGLAQVLFVALWLLCVFGYQFKLQIMYDWPGHWLYCFYYDSILMQGTIWLGSTLFFTALRLARSLPDGRSFFRLSSAAFLALYSFLLVYSFYLARTKSGDVYPMNFNLLATLRSYLGKIKENPYEIWMLILGNLFCFTPLGYMFFVLLRKCSRLCRRTVIALFGPIAFSLLEYSQYVFQIGYCEIDDMVANTLGFWLGAALVPLSDWLAKRLTKQKIQHFWELK